jgi:hypothetical protein
MDPVESKDTTAEINARCENNMLMSGDIVGVHAEQNCVIL